MNRPEAMVRAADAARTSYGRLLALLAARCGDVTTAEDALADAFERAVRHWLVEGVPANPDAWLLTVARNRVRDVLAGAPARRTVVFDPARDDPGLLDRIDPETLEDRRLELMFVCAHPAIDPAVRTPLMLNTLLGCTAGQIGRAFSVPTATMAARLTRAKKRIRQARIPFRVPERAELPARVDAVLETVYGAFAIDWHTTGRERNESLTGEALYLAEVLTQVLPEDPEAHGLAALIDLCTARAAARTDTAGEFVPLECQDRGRWDAELVARGHAHLRRAYSFATVGRFQLEAAIQAAEGAGADPVVLLDAHRALHRFAPTLGSATSLAAATARVHGPAAGLAVLAAEVGDRRFQPACPPV